MRKRTITLVVVPDGTRDLSCCARVQFEHGQCVVTRLRRSAPPAPGPAPAPPPPIPPAPPAPAVLQLRLEGPTLAPRYDILRFKLTVVNAGRGAARRVVVENVLPSGLDFLTSVPSIPGDNPLVWTVGDLLPGATKTLEYQVAAKEVGSLRTRAVVRAEGGLKREVFHVLRVEQPSMAVVKTGPKRRLVGRPATYVLTVSNPGPFPLTHVELTDDLPLHDSAGKPSGLEFVSASDGGRLQGNKVVWDLGTLAVGEQRVMQLTIRSRRAGNFNNVCIATAERGLTEQGHTRTVFEDRAGLAVEIDKDRDPLPLGQEALITLRLYNGGKVGETNLTVVATLPDGLQLLQIKEPPGAATVGAKITFPKARDFRAGEERIAVLRVRAVKTGVQRLQVEAATDAAGPGKPIRAEETLTVVPAAAGRAK